MAERTNIEGRCLCGATTVTATVATPTLVTCHCEMCRRESGSFSMSVITSQQDTVVSGPVKTFRSSEWAERAFCETCGSRLWYSTIHDGARYLSAGLFENAAGASVAVEYFADNCPQGYALAGNHERLTAEETLAFFAGEDPAGPGND